MTPGDLFPSDRVLAERYKVARMTVTREVGNLVAKGLLERIPGKGTYVHRPSGMFETLSSFTDMATWYQATARIMSVRAVKPTRAQTETLVLEPGENVIRIHRLRLSDGEPLAVERVYLAARRFGTLTREALEGRSLYRVLADQFDAHAYSADQTITLRPVSKTDGQLLQIETDTPVMHIDRTTHDNMGLVMDMSTAWCHPHRFTVHVHIGLT